MNIHKSALDKLTQILTPESPFMRIQIQAGGCSGFEKVFEMSSSPEHDDLIFQDVIIVDPISYDLIKNAQLSYSTNLSGASFELSIPESTANCGCGKSFTI